MAQLLRRRASVASLSASLSAILAIPSTVIPRTAAAAAPTPIRLVRFDSAAAFDAGTHDGALTAGETLTLASGATYGAWTSPLVEPGFLFGRLVPSWNALTPGSSFVQVEVQVRLTTQSGDAGEAAPWYALGTWTEDDTSLTRTSVRGQADAVARVDTDTLVARAAPFAAFALRVTLRRASPTDPTPSVQLVSGVVSSPAGAETFSPHPPNTQRTFSPIELSVPSYSQELHARHFPQWAGGGEAWCSPASTEMVVEYWGHRPTDSQLAWIPTGHPDPTVDYAARATYDAAYRGTGNWPFNTAYAARYGLRAFVTQLRSLAEAEQFLRAGIPLVASIRAAPRELTGFPLSQGTNGHLLVIAGIDAGGNPIVHDPAAPTNATVRRTYDRAQFQRSWLRGSGGTVYVIHPPDMPLPGLPADVTANW
ncbi:MAG: hypothetical protein AVDCRST_MAG77-3600 [uncultured Chloroflexi bacterium]|uniref:Peptidase C39-like domain-containing protein n=1 Tax=uncultured Chloroflexota bacterium TaxID=166587 RepID=A0A6J4JHX5_9CHLR|nr:MAG: hypothetical protein AVDCRST_MAG77-3600 [uncultured Chloroflexota bacterium]